MTTTVTTTTTQTKPKMLTLREAAKLIDGVCESRIRRYCKDGELRHVKAGNKYLISERTLLDFFGCQCLTTKYN